MNLPTVTLTVTQVNEYIKGLLDASRVLSRVCLCGEISNFTNHYKSGHFYFTLKDENSLIKAVMFQSYASRLKFLPENHMNVVVRGRVTSFPRDGVYQIYCEHMEPYGVGALYAALERSKARLAEQGLFDPMLKKPIPRFPKRVGIVTSPIGAAVADMKNILSSRYPLCDILIYPALVQGPDAPQDLCEGIRYFDKTNPVDVIIIGRGGGSIEDLWAFNSEQLAQEIFDCQTPVISAVGHETDYTICDFVADARAETPSAAAAMAVPDRQELFGTLHQIAKRSHALVTGLLDAKKRQLCSLSEDSAFSLPQKMLLDRQRELSILDQSIHKSVSRLVCEKKNQLNQAARQLEGLNPMSVLARGFCAAYTAGGALVASVGELTKGLDLTLAFHDGKANAKVTSVDRDPSSGQPETTVYAEV